VVDASVAVKWLNPSETLSDRASIMRDDYKQGLVSLLVPAFWDYEVVNGMNKAVARGDLTAPEGREAIELLLAITAQRMPLPSPHESYNLARKYQRSVYDSWYLALAEEMGCAFWTADRRLYNAVKDRLAFVRWLGDYMEGDAEDPPAH
jgi:predicted nucleic acid-binding protein